MLVILNHAGPLEGHLEVNYDLRNNGTIFQNEINKSSNIVNKNINNKDSVSLKKCISLSSKNNNNNLMSINNNNNNNNYINSLPSDEYLNDINFEREQNASLIKEKNDLEEFYKNILLKLNEDDRRREEEMRLHVMNMNSHIKYLEQKKQKLENFNYILNTNYMDRKFDFDLTDKNITKEIEKNITKNKLLLKGINDSIKKAKLENDINQKEYDKRSKQLSSTLRNQIKVNKETTALAQKQLDEINKIYEQKINIIKNKYDKAEEKYKILKEKLNQNGDLQHSQASKNEFEKIIQIFRERMKQHEKYINEIKQMAEGDYDHFEIIKETTQNKNREFFDAIKETEMNLNQFLEEILKAKREYEKLIPYIHDIIQNGSEVNDNGNNN